MQAAIDRSWHNRIHYLSCDTILYSVIIYLKIMD